MGPDRGRKNPIRTEMISRSTVVTAALVSATLIASAFAQEPPATTLKLVGTVSEIDWHNGSISGHSGHPEIDVLVDDPAGSGAESSGL